MNIKSNLWSEIRLIWQELNQIRTLPIIPGPACDTLIPVPKLEQVVMSRTEMIEYILTHLHIPQDRWKIMWEHYNNKNSEDLQVVYNAVSEMVQNLYINQLLLELQEQTKVINNTLYQLGKLNVEIDIHIPENVGTNPSIWFTSKKRILVK